MHYDYVLVGGGLQNSLLALTLIHKRPGSRVALIERADTLGGNHTWCFHADDITEEALRIIAPLIIHEWSGYEVHFPGHSRVLDTGYAAVTSERLHRVVRDTIAGCEGCTVLTGKAATEIEAHRVTLEGGDQLDATLVIDARGPGQLQATDSVSGSGYQKFHGMELHLAHPHGLKRPVLMDATVPQIDGFRFLYTLPLDTNRILVEDTYFSDTADLDSGRIRERIIAYAGERGYQIADVGRQEHGVLPLPWDMQSTAHAPTTNPGGYLIAGYQGGWFHPVTGYSFPVAMRLADYVASVAPDAVFGPGYIKLVTEQMRQMKYAHRLNKMLFNWFAPHNRYHVLERFYRLPEATIRRFYAMRLTAGDRARILMGRPPKGMSLRAALTGRSAIRSEQ